MSVDKVILRAFLSTLAAIGTLFLFMIIALCAVFPSTMMEVTYNLGMENSSIHFAERAYKGSEDIYYIAYATEVAIEEGKNGKIVSCGEKFIEDKAFAGYCQRKGDSYSQFIYGKVCVSKYLKGDKQAAIDFAKGTLSGAFPKNNALVAVLITAIEQKDTDTVTTIREEISGMSIDRADDMQYLQDTLAFIDATMGN